MSLYGALKPRVKYKKMDNIYKIIKMEKQAWPKAAAEKDRRILESAQK